MIDIELLEYLIVISESNSLLEASEKLKMTQPTLTRQLQKLEDELGLLLFDRYANKIILNDNGKKVIKESKDLIDSYYRFTKTIDNYKDYIDTIKIGYESFGSIFKFQDKLFDIFKGKKITYTYDTFSNLEEGLKNKTYDIIFTLKQIKMDSIISYPIIKENLMISVPTDNFLALEKYLTFSDIAFCKFNPTDSIFLNNIKKNIPDIFIDNEYKDTNFSFDTNLCYHMNKKDNRTFIKITDKDAYINNYISYNKNLDKYLSELK